MNDDRLHGMFAELRRAETGHVPPLRWPSPRSHAVPRLAIAALLLIIMAVATLPLLRHRTPPTQSITTWRAPTDFLLDTPGRELLKGTAP